MNTERLHTIILKPWVTEKTGLMEADACYAFKVRKDASKREIAQAIALMFNVEVASVRTLIMKGEVKKQMRTPGQTKSYKKAMVRLKDGHVISMAQFANNEQDK